MLPVRRTLHLLASGTGARRRAQSAWQAVAGWMSTSRPPRSRTPGCLTCCVASGVAAGAAVTVSGWRRAGCGLHMTRAPHLLLASGVAAGAAV